MNTTRGVSIQDGADRVYPDECNADVGQFCVDSLMLIQDPGELLLVVLLGTLRGGLLLCQQPDVMLRLLESEFGIDNLLLLRLEIFLEIRKLVIKGHKESALVFEFGFSRLVIGCLLFESLL